MSDESGSARNDTTGSKSKNVKGRDIPSWIILPVTLFLLLMIGGLIYLLLKEPTPTATPGPSTPAATPTATPAATPPPPPPPPPCPSNSGILIKAESKFFTNLCPATNSFCWTFHRGPGEWNDLAPGCARIENENECKSSYERTDSENWYHEGTYKMCVWDGVEENCSIGDQECIPDMVGDDENKKPYCSTNVWQPGINLGHTGGVEDTYCYCRKDNEIATSKRGPNDVRQSRCKANIEQSEAGENPIQNFGMVLEY